MMQCIHKPTAALFLSLLLLHCDPSAAFIATNRVTKVSSCSQSDLFKTSGNPQGSCWYWNGAAGQTEKQWRCYGLPSNRFSTFFEQSSKTTMLDMSETSPPRSRWKFWKRWNNNFKNIHYNSDNNNNNRDGLLSISTSSSASSPSSKYLLFNRYRLVPGRLAKLALAFLAPWAVRPLQAFAAGGGLGGVSSAKMVPLERSVCLCLKITLLFLFCLPNQVRAQTYVQTTVNDRRFIVLAY
jgi:hypothetical protein